MQRQHRRAPAARHFPQDISGRSSLGWRVSQIAALSLAVTRKSTPRALPVPRTQRAVARFGPALNTICLPLGRGQIPVRENWELEQSSTENHNFDVHQSRLWVQTSAATDSVLAPIVNPGRRWRYSPRDMPMGVAVPDAIIVPDNHSGACFAKRPLRFDAGPCRHYSPTLAGSLTIVTSSNTRTKDGQDTGGAVTVLTRPMHLRSGSNSRVCS
jgi:hypothetical protein